MEWGQFEESKVEYPEVVVGNQISGFRKATKDLLDLRVTEVRDISKRMSGLSTDFQFELGLFSSFVKSYVFEIIQFGYDVNLYPVVVKGDTEILKELFPGKHISSSSSFTCATEKDLTDICVQIFKTNKFKETVEGLMKIASKNRSVTETPF